MAPDGSIRPQGEGEFVCQSPCVMKGFFGNPEALSRIVRDGWLYTGDAVLIDEAGYIHHKGRIDGMIIRGGYNIYASEIEHVYAAHPDVVECCAFPVPHEALGQQTCLAVRLREGADDDPLALREFSRGKISKYKIPDYVVVFDELPKLPTDKYDMKAIRRECEARIEKRP